jgi:hypothetical protein
MAASVARIGGRRSLTTSKPLHAPASAAAPSASAIATETLVEKVRAATEPATLITGPSAGSMPLVMTTRNCPSATSASGRTFMQSVFRSNALKWPPLSAKLITNSTRNVVIAPAAP